MATYIYPISFKVGQLIIDNEGQLTSVQEVDFCPAEVETVGEQIVINDGFYDVLLQNSKGEQQWWEYKAGESTCALLGETFAKRFSYDID